MLNTLSYRVNQEPWALIRYAAATLAVVVWVTSLWLAAAAPETKTVRFEYKPGIANVRNPFDLLPPPMRGVLKIPPLETNLPREYGEIEIDAPRPTP